MKVLSAISTLLVAAALASCSSNSEKASGNYTGNYSSTSLPVGNGTATAYVTAESSDIVNINIQSAGNPDLLIPDVHVQNILNVLVLDLAPGASGSLSSSVTGNMLSIAYSADTTSISFNGSK